MPPAHAQATLPRGALPQGERIQAGEAEVTRPSGGAMTIRQSTDRMAIEWQRFDIDPSASVRFIQPGPGSVAVNRVIGGSPSGIDGTLTANGQVFLLNEQGVIFGPDAKVSAAALGVSTLKQKEDWADLDVVRLKQQQGKGEDLRLAGVVRLSEGGIAIVQGGKVAIAGSPRSPGGHLWVRGAEVALENGSRQDLQAPGVVEPGSVDIESTGRLDVGAVMVVGAEAAGGGAIRLHGETVALNGGLSVTSETRDGGSIDVLGRRGVGGDLTMDARGGRNGGRVTLRAPQRRIDLTDVMVRVDGAERQGGEVVLTGESIRMTGRQSGVISANGATRGGRIELKAEGTLAGTLLEIMPRAEISAYATVAGDGGRVSLVSATGLVAGDRVNLRVGGRGPEGRPGTIDLLTRSRRRPTPFLDFGTTRGGQLNLRALAWEIGDGDPPLRGDQRPDADTAPARLRASEVSTWLDEGRAVHLQAMETMTVKRDVVSHHSSAGDLSLTGERTALDASIRLAAGDLALRTQPFRGDVGGITMAPGVDIRAPGGRVSLELPAPDPDGDSAGGAVLTLGVVEAAELVVNSRSASIDVVVADKVYDGTTRATLEHQRLRGITLLPGSNLSSQVEAAFVDKEVGRDKVAKAQVWLTGHNGDRRAALPLHEIVEHFGDTETRRLRSWETVATISPLPRNVADVDPTLTLIDGRISGETPPPKVPEEPTQPQPQPLLPLPLPLPLPEVPVVSEVAVSPEQPTVPVQPAVPESPMGPGQPTVTAQPHLPIRPSTPMPMPMPLPVQPQTATASRSLIPTVAAVGRCVSNAILGHLPQQSANARPCEERPPRHLLKPPPSVLTVDRGTRAHDDRTPREAAH